MGSPTSFARGVAAPASMARGVAWILLATFLWVGSDSLVKFLSQAYPTPQILWARYTVNALVVVLLLNRRLPAVARSARPSLQLFRSCMTLGSTSLFFFALRTIPIADANAVFFFAPILVTALAVPLLGESVGFRRWIGVLVGLTGVLVIIRPGFAHVQVGLLLVIASAVINAVFQIITRLLSRSDHAWTTMLYTPVVGCVVTSGLLPFFWTPPDLAGWSLLVALGLCSGGGHAAMVKAFEAADAAAVTPFNYAGLIWAVLFGYLLFGDFPDGWTFAGAGLIVAGGIYILHRQRVRRA